MRQSILRALELTAVAAGIAPIVDLQWWSAAVTFPPSPSQCSQQTHSEPESHLCPPREARRRPAGFARPAEAG